jgi:hypothetical protein
VALHLLSFFIAAQFASIEARRAAVHDTVIQVGLDNRALTRDFQLRIAQQEGRYVATVTNLSADHFTLDSTPALVVVLDDQYRVVELTARPLGTGVLLTKAQARAMSVSVLECKKRGLALDAVHLTCKEGAERYTVWVCPLPGKLNADIFFYVSKDYRILDSRRTHQRNKRRRVPMSKPAS